MPLQSIYFTQHPPPIKNSGQSFIYCGCCAQLLSCLTICDLLDCSRPGFPVLHCLPKFAQVYVHRVSDAIELSSSAAPFFCIQSFPSSGSFPMSELFTSGGQSIGVSASASAFSMNSQGWFPLGFIGWISLQSKGLWRIFSNTAVQRHQFFSTQPSLWSNSHIYTWLLEKP